MLHRNAQVVPYVEQYFKSASHLPSMHATALPQVGEGIVLQEDMRKKVIQLPKEYISFSQLALWQNDPDRYKDLYFDNRDELRNSNRGMEYGKVVADALEKGIETGDLLTDAGMLLLPKYDIRDVEFRAQMNTKEGWITLLAKPDSLDSVTKSFYEYKTGKTVWTQKKAQDHLQMHFYATAIYLAYKVIPKGAKLIWIQTEQVGDAIQPTGHVKEFPVVFTLNDILKTMALISKVAKEIEIAFMSHVRNPHLDTY